VVHVREDVAEQGAEHTVDTAGAEQTGERVPHRDAPRPYLGALASDGGDGGLLQTYQYISNINPLKIYEQTRRCNSQNVIGNGIHPAGRLRNYFDFQFLFILFINIYMTVIFALTIQQVLNKKSWKKRKTRFLLVA